MKENSCIVGYSAHTALNATGWANTNLIKSDPLEFFYDGDNFNISRQMISLHFLQVPSYEGPLDNNVVATKKVMDNIQAAVYLYVPSHRSLSA